MYISKAVSNYIYFLRYLRLFEVFNPSGKCPLWDEFTQASICRAFVWSGKCPLGICLVGEVSTGDVSGRGSVRRVCVWSGKCPSRMCLVGEMYIGDLSGRENVCRGSVRRGRVRRENVRRGCVWEFKLPPTKKKSKKNPSSITVKLI